MGVNKMTFTLTGRPVKCETTVAVTASGTHVLVSGPARKVKMCPEVSRVPGWQSVIRSAVWRIPADPGSAVFAAPKTEDPRFLNGRVIVCEKGSAVPKSGMTL